MRPVSTASMAFSASGLVLTNHWVETSGSTTVLQRWQVPRLSGVILDLDEIAALLQIGHHAAAGFEAVEAGVGAGGGGHDAVFVDHLDLRQVVAASGFEIVEVVRGGDLDHAGAEFGVGQLVEDDGDLAIHQGQLDGLAVQVEVARVLRVDGDGGIAEHGFGAGGGHGHEAAGHAVDGVADVPEVALHVGVRHFEIGDRGVAARAPVDHVLAAVDQALFVQADEDLADGAREAGIEREALARPVAAGAQADHLVLDGVAGLRLPFPDALLELLAAEVAAVDALFGQFARHHHLGGDAGVVGAGQPEGVVAEHAVPADGDVDLGVFEHVADVQRPGHVGRRNDERKYAARAPGGGAEDAGVDPPLGPVRLKPLGLVHFFDLHGEVTMITGEGGGLLTEPRP